MAEEAKIEGLFQPPPTIKPCSWLQCKAGHRWPPDLIVTKCPGCGGPYIAIRQQGCPFCNEPVVEVNLRTDFVPTGTGAVPRCKGAKVMGETVDQQIIRQAHTEAEKNWKTFLEKEAEENGKKSGGQGSAG